MDINPIINYYKNGNKQWERWSLNGKLHRLDGPAFIAYYESGQIQREEWYIDDDKHKIGSPAII